MAFRLLLHVGAALLACGALAVDALATADVTRLGGNISVVARFQPGPESDGNHGIVLENILPADTRVRQQAFGDPTITSNFCRVNPLFNDVVCEDVLFDVSLYTISMGDGKDRVRVQQNRDQSPCPVTTPFWTVRVELGIGDDTFDTAVAGAQREDCIGSGGTFGYRVEVDGNGGNDTIDAQFASGGVLKGSSGNNVLRGSGVGDVLEGGGGADTLEGRGGPDSMSGQSGKDILRGEDGDDALKGGSGNDILRGVGGGDTLKGGDGTDEVFGNAGNDDLQGEDGDDTLTGGAGGDAMDGDEGTDTLRSRDGVRDLVDCGPGGPDLAEVDLQDRVRNCEFVDNFAMDDGPPGAPLGRSLRIGEEGLAMVRIACPRAARVRCRGRLGVRDPKHPERVLASASYAIRVGARRRVTLQLTSAERALLRRRSRALVTTREKGRSRLGPRSAQRLLGIARS